MLSTLCLVLLSTAPDAGTTRTSMREMFDALATLQWAVATPSTLKDAASLQAVSRELETLSGMSHAFPASPKDQEPATAALSSLFARYAAETKRRVDAGDTAAVPLRVRTLTSLCFSCHSRERAPQDFDDAHRRFDALALSDLERAQLLAATRQFDAALLQYRRVLASPAAGERGLLEYARALQDSLAILVRVKDDPAAAAALLDEAARRPGLPAHLQGTIAAWRKDVASWRQEAFNALKASPDALSRRAEALVRKAHGATSFMADTRSDVAFLRASAYLNLALAKNPKLKTRGEALYLLGLCTGALKSPLLWEVDGLFFEACVRENPKSALARRCFQQLSDRVVLGFTGSAGTQVPDDELQRLAELRALAE